MNFTLKQLRYFHAAMRSGSIVKAAEDMSISQSSITAAIDGMEQALEAQLFRRVPAKGIVPTPTGKQVGQRVSNFLEQARIFEADLMSIGREPVGTLRLGCFDPVAPYVLPPILTRIAKNYPGIRIELMEGDLGELAEQLRSGSLDVALIYQSDPPMSVTFEGLFHAEPWALIPDGSPLAEQSSVSLNDLADEPMVLLDLPSSRGYIFSLFRARRLRPNVVHSTKSGTVVRGLVASRIGYSILNVCGEADRSGQNGYVARAVRDATIIPEFGVGYVAGLEGSALVQAVRKTAIELRESRAFEHLNLTA